MTPNQGDNPNEPRGRQQSGSNYQQQPSQPPRQPPTGQFQGGSPQQGRQSTPGQQPPTQGRGGASQRGSSGIPQSQSPPGQQGQPGGAPGQQSPTQAPGAAQQQPSGGIPQQQQPPSSPAQSGPPAQAGAIPTQQMGGQGMAAQGAGGMAGQPGAMGAQRSRGMPMEPVTIDEIVATDVVTAEPDTPISTVVSKMAEEEVGSVVVTEDDSPAGVITDRSIALALENTPDVANKQAGDLVSDDVVTGTTEMSAFDALDQISDETIRRLPIVDEEGNLEGIVTLDDLLVLLSSELQKAGETIREQSPRL